MADSVGKGIALGERFKYDTTSGTKMLNDAIQYKVASDRKKEADAVSSLDFKIDYKKLLPLYGKAISEIAAQTLNKYAQYKREDPRTALNRVQEDFYIAQQEIGRLTRDNEAAKNYVSQEAGFAKNPDLVNAFISTDSDFDAISKYNNGDFLNIGKRGEFAFRPIKVMNPSAHVKYDEQDYDIRFGGTKPIGIAGKTQIEQIEAVKPEAIARNAVALTTNPQFRDNVLLSRPDLIGLPEKEQYSAIYNEAFKISTQLARAPKSEWKIVDLPNPTGSGSGDKDKREKPVIVKNTRQTLQFPTGSTKKVTKMDILSGKSITTDEPEMYNEESNIDLSASVAGAPAVTIPLDGRVIDARTNKFIKGEDLNQNVTFRPDNVQTEVIKKTGKREVYVLGEAKVNVVDEETGTSSEKIINYKVPYDKVKSPIEKKFDLSDFFADFDKLTAPNIKGKPQPTTPKPTKTVIAPNNSTGVKPEM